jgi:hypothetical protein
MVVRLDKILPLVFTVFSFYIGNQPGLAAHPQIKTKYDLKVKNCNWQVDLRQIEHKSRQVSW